MVECDNCGFDVSNGYARVFGDNDGIVHECLNCREDSMLDISVEDRFNNE